MTEIRRSDCSQYKRHVFFISGFDPKGASYYHALHQTEAAKQDTVTGTTTTVGRRTRDAAGNSQWIVNSNANAQSPTTASCSTVYEFSRWDDIVRKHWPRSVWRLLADLVFGYALIIRSGGIATTWRLSRKTLVGLAYPLAVVGGCLLAATALSWWIATVSSRLGATPLVAIVTGGAVMASGLWGTRLLESRLNSTWLVRIFSFSGRYALGQLPELDERLSALAWKISDTLQRDDVDEVLVVGFSVGSILSVSAVARVLAQQLPRPVAGAPVLSLMTLGHCIPMLGLLPQAVDFRGDLKILAADPNLRWVDFSSVTDWGSFAMVDPVDACRITLPDGQKYNPTMRSPRFHTQFSAASYDRIRRNKRRIHMQYLMAAELPAEYDYFAITAGDLSLDERYPRAAATAR